MSTLNDGSDVVTERRANSGECSREREKGQKRDTRDLDALPFASSASRIVLNPHLAFFEIEIEKLKHAKVETG